MSWQFIKMYKLQDTTLLIRRKDFDGVSLKRIFEGMFPVYGLSLHWITITILWLARIFNGTVSVRNCLKFEGALETFAEIENSW